MNASTEDIELFPEEFFADREIIDVVDDVVNGKKIIYAEMSDGVIVPLFRAMNQ